MDWSAFLLSLRLSAWTTLVLLGIGLLVARSLAWRQFRGKVVVEAVVALPLVLPPTVMGFYLLILLGPGGAIGQWWVQLTDGCMMEPEASVSALVFHHPNAHYYAI